MRVMFLHGLESGNKGSKAKFLEEAFPGEVIVPDFEGVLDVEERIAKAATYLTDEPQILVGSSFGGLVACRLANMYPDKVTGLVLMAPALNRAGAELIHTMPKNTVIIHGIGDTVIPVEVSREFATRFRLSLVEVNDDHRLHNHMELMKTGVEFIIFSQAQAS